MEMILEGSNSAEASPPSGGGIGSHLLSLRDGGGGLVVNFFDLFFHLRLFTYYLQSLFGLTNQACQFVSIRWHDRFLLV